MIFYGSYEISVFQRSEIGGLASVDTVVMRLSQIYASSFCTLLKTCLDLILITMIDSDVEY
jgi:hypothetical protein